MLLDMNRRCAAAAYLAVEAAPAHLYEVESAAYGRRWRTAVGVVSGLMVATGHAERLQVRPGRAEYERHAHDVQEFARLARQARERNPGWQPDGIFCRWLSGRSVTWPEVVQCLGPQAPHAPTAQETTNGVLWLNHQSRRARTARKGAQR